MNAEILRYNQSQKGVPGQICRQLAATIDRALMPSAVKIYYGSPVWFIDDNPIVGYSVTKKGSVELLFWSGQSFDEPGLTPAGKYKAAKAIYSTPETIDATALERWLQKSREIQWDYTGIRINQGKLVKKPNRN
jgi:hypothetical protein